MWQVRDYFSGRFYDSRNCIRFVNEIIEGIKFYEYTRDVDKVMQIRRGGRFDEYYNRANFEDKVIFNKSKGVYEISIDLDPKVKVYCDYGSAVGYNYTFTKVYSANKHLDYFNGRQKLVDPEYNFRLTPFLKYSLGIEFETATGIIPESVCYRDGLIPLRDGSITGNEYSTVVLEGNYGLNLLRQQINTMKQYTFFDKNCSLHIHLGNIPLNTTFIYNVYKVAIALQNQLEGILPAYTFKSSLYKNTGKDYCKKLPTNLTSFELFYRFMVGLNYFGDLNQPHPNDVTREHKWNINTRYYFINFINALCYRNGKTIEFRFLRPTYNINKIFFWIYIFNAMLIAAESNFVPENLEELVYNVYPEDVAKDLITNIIKVGLCSDIQGRIEDYIGARTDIEDRIFDTSELI